MTEADRPSSPADLAPTTGKKLIAADDDRFECRACGHIYNPNKGDPTTKVIAGTPFSVLPEIWKCPVCTAKKTALAISARLVIAKSLDLKKIRAMDLVSTP